MAITKIQYLLGHASVVATERYIHHTLAELAKAASVLEGGGVFDPDAKPRPGVATVGGARLRNGAADTSDVH